MLVVNKKNIRSYLKHSRAPSELFAFAGYIFVHLVCLRSLLEVHFSSTIVRDVLPIQWSSQPSARRLVLFVSDGLRADKFFELDENQKPRSPFLRNVIANEGLWGVSHTQAPTESRSAHTAMLGGFYEDPSTIRALFRSNPVEFDTVLNESKETWCYGGNDVIPFFNRGTAADHVHVTAHQYHLRKHADLDKWSLSMLQKLFDDAKGDADIRTRLQSDKIIFFLHLAGVDTNGHAFHPGSKQYLENIQEVDDVVKRTVDLFNSYFEFDNKTAYIFTGDHGMTDSGGHGSTSLNETKTPFIAWGSGIVKEQEQQYETQLTPSEISETKKWQLDPTTRHDIQQIDVSIFMAALIGVPFPVNSVGRVPIDYFPKGRINAEICYQRVQQLVKTLETKKNHIKDNDIYIFFWQYKIDEDGMISTILQDIEKSIENLQYDDAIKKSSDLAEFVIKALVHYHNFSNHIALLCTVSSIISWIIFAMLKYLSIRNISLIQYKRPSLRYCTGVVIVLIALVLRIHSFHSEWIYYLYVAIPFHIWVFLIPQITNLFNALDYKIFYSKHFLCYGIGMVLWLFFTIQGFYNRKYFAIVALSLAVFPFVNGFKNLKFLIIWSVLCISLSIFPLLPNIVSQSHNKVLIFLAGICGQVYCVLIARYHRIFGISTNSPKRKVTYFVLLFSVVLPSLVVIFLARGHVNEIVALILVIASWVFPLFCTQNSFQRLAVFNCLHIAIYILFSESHDAIFYVVFTALLHLWVVMEGDESSNECVTIGKPMDDHSKNEGERRKRICDDIRNVCIFVSCLAISFFSLYSIADMNHFHPRNMPFIQVSSSFRLQLVFIYKMLLRLLAPIFAFCTLLKRKNLQITLHWYIVSAIFDVMFLFFFFSVKTSGSWAEIGVSVVNVCVTVGTPIATAVLLLIGRTMVAACFPV